MPSGPAKRVLVVDDEELIRQLLSLALARGAWTVDTAASAEEALLLFAKNTYGVLVIDKNLPGMSGVDLIRRVRQQEEACAILMITAYGSVDSALETLHLGIEGYLEKPFDDILTVVRAVEEAFAKHERRRATGSLAGAVSHFRKATGHLEAIAQQEARGVKLVVAVATVSDQDAAWVTARLSEAGDTVVRIKSGAELLLRAREAPPDVMLIDADLCEPDIVAQVAELRMLARDMAVVVITARPPLNLVARLIRLDVLGVLEKPLDDEQFRRRLPAVIDRLRARSRRQEDRNA